MDYLYFEKRKTWEQVIAELPRRAVDAIYLALPTHPDRVWSDGE